MKKRGLFITLEGIEGAGKSTALRLLVERLQQEKIDFILTREPGGTVIAEEIRRVILQHYPENMHPDTELLLYFASRAQHLHITIKEALHQGSWVLCDRFTDTTYAYQGAGRGLDMARIKMLEDWVQGGLRPDKTLLFDLSAELGLARIQNRATRRDRIEEEQLSFFTRARQHYLSRAQLEPQRFHLIDAAQNLSSVAAQLNHFLDHLLQNRCYDVI